MFYCVIGMRLTIEHCLDKDSVGFVRFNHAVDDKLFFDLGRKVSLPVALAFVLFILLHY